MLGKYPNVCATHWPNLNQGILSFALWVACIVPTSPALRLAPKALDIDENADAQPVSIEDKQESANELHYLSKATLQSPRSRRSVFNCY